MEKKREITHEILTVGVELSSVVVSCNVNLGLVNETSDLDVIRSLDVLNALEGTVGDEASTTALLGAPSDLLALRVSDGRVGLGRGPETEVYERSPSRQVSVTNPYVKRKRE